MSAIASPIADITAMLAVGVRPNIDDVIAQAAHFGLGMGCDANDRTTIQVAGKLDQLQNFPRLAASREGHDAVVRRD
jgi:hypothetical protein